MRAALALILALSAAPAAGQGTSVDLGGAAQDASDPLEIAADSLDVDQTDQSAVFVGNVEVTQGEVRLTANEVRVEYVDGDTQSEIRRLIATGEVLLVNGADAAESQRATYSPADGEVVMTGDVILTQEGAALSGERLVLDLAAGTGRMDGRVRSIFRTSQ